MAKMTKIAADVILDSRGKETVEVKVTTDSGIMAAASVPSGTSTGSFEAMAINPKQASANVNEVIAPKLLGGDPRHQEEIDQTLLELDGTANKAKLGANAILGVSLAVSRAAAMEEKMPLFWYLNKLYNQISGEKTEPSIPTPMMVMIEGGKHADNGLCIQEFLCLTSLANGEKIWNRLKENLRQAGLATKLGLEGGFTPKLSYDEDAVKFIFEAINDEKLSIPQDVQLGLDIAANHCQINHEDILAMLDRYPIFSLEDPFAENEWHHWAQLKLELDQRNKDYLLIGDDLFVTDKKRLQKGVNNLVANGIIIKVNQVGTLTETLQVINLARKANYTNILSHRSGETMDTYIADLAVATAAKYIKSGAPYASERVIKYNRLNEIAQEL